MLRFFNTINWKLVKSKIVLQIFTCRLNFLLFGQWYVTLCTWRNQLNGKVIRFNILHCTGQYYRVSFSSSSNSNYSLLYLHLTSKSTWNLVWVKNIPFVLIYGETSTGKSLGPYLGRYRIPELRSLEMGFPAFWGHFSVLQCLIFST